MSRWLLALLLLVPVAQAAITDVTPTAGSETVETQPTVSALIGGNVTDLTFVFDGIARNDTTLHNGTFTWTPPTLAPGRHEANLTVVGDDNATHVWTFTVLNATAPREGGFEPTPPTDPPLWPYILGAAAIVGVALVWMRRRPKASGDALFSADARVIQRRRNELAMQGLLMGTALLTVAILAVLLWRMLSDGIAAFDWDFWSQRYSPGQLRLGGASGILDSLIATISVLGMTMLFAIPIGTAGGIYLHEYAGNSRLTEWIRTTVSNLAGVPSIVYGLLGLAVFVKLLALGASNISSALTLAVLILPIIIVATEEALRTVPQSVRDASLAMGASKWQTIRHHILPYALPGILTGQILALSRAAGETAPLIVLGIPSFSILAGAAPLAPGAPLQLRAYTLAADPNQFAREDAFGAVLVLLLATLILNLLAIYMRQRLSRKIQW